MSDNATIVKILDRAADYVDQGWCQHDGEREINGQLCYCAYGAMQKARLDVAFFALTEPVVRAVKKHIGLSDESSIFDWNDAPGRTQQEVVDTLRAVARKVEAKG
jgi:hypothetical protein